MSFSPDDIFGLFSGTTDEEQQETVEAGEEFLSDFGTFLGGAGIPTGDLVAPVEDIAVGTSDTLVEAAGSEFDATPGVDGGQTGLQQVEGPSIAEGMDIESVDVPDNIDLGTDTSVSAPDGRPSDSELRQMSNAEKWDLYQQGVLGPLEIGDESSPAYIPPEARSRLNEQPTVTDVPEDQEFVPVEEQRWFQEAQEENFEEMGPFQEMQQRLFTQNEEATDALGRSVERGDVLGALSGGTKLTVDAIVDNPGFTVGGRRIEPSLQGTVQGAMLEAYQFGAGEDATIEDLARDFQAGARGALQSAGVLHPGNYVPRIRVDTPVGTVDTKQTANYIGDFGGGLVDAFAVAPAAAGTGVLTGINPLPNYDAFQNPREAEVTGETEALPPPEEYIFDLAGLGIAAEGGRAARLLDRLPTGAASSGADEAAAAASTGASMSALDELITFGARGADEFPRILSGGDEVVQAGTTQAEEAARLSQQSFEEFITQGPTDIGTSDEFLSGTLTAQEEVAAPTTDLADDIFANPSLPGGTDLGARTVDEVEDLQIPDSVSQAFSEGGVLDEFREPAEETGGFVSRFVDEFQDPEAGSSIFGGADEVSGATDEAVDEAIAGVDETVDEAEEFGVLGTTMATLEDVTPTFDEFFQTADEGAAATDEALAGADEGFERTSDIFAGADEATDADVARAIDEVDEGARAGDEVAAAGRGGGDGGGGGRLFGAGGGGGDEGGGLLSRLLTGRNAVIGGGLLLGGGLLASALTPDDQADRPQEVNGWTYVPLGTLRANDRIGLLYEIRRRGTTRGYTVFVRNGDVLTRGGSTRDANLTARQVREGTSPAGDDSVHLEPVFDTRSGARRAFQQWAQGGGTDPSPSEVWDASLDAPSQVEQGERFSASAEVRNTGSSQASANFILALRASDGTEARLDSSSARVGANRSATVQFNVPQQVRRLPAGDYQLTLFADGDGSGRVASTSMTITGGPGGQGQEGRWNTEILGELGAGWYLVRQTHSQEDRQRFIVAGKRDDGTRIYIYPGGQVRESPHHFSSRQEAVSAFEAWAQRHQSGETTEDETPSSSGARPSSGGVSQDSREKTGGPGGQGLVGTAADIISSPAGLAGLVVLGAAIWYASGGEPIAWLRGQANDIIEEVS